eukprot:7896216-Alexandrium_andersonii.AAC.1
MASISLMRPSGRQGPRPRSASAGPDHRVRGSPSSPGLVDEHDELDGRGWQPAQLAPRPAADAVSVALPAH